MMAWCSILRLKNLIHSMYVASLRHAQQIPGAMMTSGITTQSTAQRQMRVIPLVGIADCQM